MWTVLRTYDLRTASGLLGLAGVVHVVVGEQTVVVPGSVGSGTLNAALVAGLLAGAAPVFALSGPTPWWAWGTTRSQGPYLATVVACSVTALLAVGLLCEALTGRAAALGWVATAGAMLALLAVLRRPAFAVIGGAALVIAAVVVAPSEPGPLAAGALATAWYGTQTVLPPTLVVPVALLALGSLLAVRTVTRLGSLPD